MAQKSIIETEKHDFDKTVNELLGSGWTLVPNTISVQSNAGYDKTKNEVWIDQIFAAVLEKNV